MNLDPRRLIDTQAALVTRHAKVCADLSRLQSSLSGGRKQLARIAALAKEADKIERALERIEKLA